MAARSNVSCARVPKKTWKEPDLRPGRDDTDAIVVLGLGDHDQFHQRRPAPGWRKASASCSVPISAPRPAPGSLPASASVNLSAYALPMLVFGVLLNFPAESFAQGWRLDLIGFGFLFLGIHYMKEGFARFADGLDLTQYALTGVVGLLTYTLFGIIATVIMQSSHATLVLIIITALGADRSGMTTLALAIGSNIGTTITAVIGALSSSIEGKRLAGAHLIFNIGTGLLALLFIDAFVVAVDWIADAVGLPTMITRSSSQCSHPVQPDR